MRKNTLFSVIGLGIAGVFLSAGIANAGQQNAFSVVGGNTVKPGQQIEFTGTCTERPWVKAQVRSTVLEDGIVALTDQSEDPNIIAGRAKVKKNAQAGTHTASFLCGDKTVSTKLTVVSANKPATSKPTTSKPAPTKAEEAGQVAVKPKGAADTGQGDVAVEAAAAPESNGSDAGLYALGGAGLLAAGGAGAFMLRRRSRA